MTDALSTGEAPRERVRILLVDDDPLSLFSLRVVLEDLGHQLVEAASGEEALRCVRDTVFAVVLLDLRLPGIDGFETARRIRAVDQGRTTPIVFVTGAENSEFPVEEAYRLGAVDYLVKPVLPVVLRAKVQGFVELHEKTEQVKRHAEQLRALERREFDRTVREHKTAMLEIEQRFSQFMQHLPGLAWIKDLGGRYVYANDAAERAFGHSREALYGRTDVEVFPPETAAAFQENDQRALTEGAGVQVVETLRQRDGSVHHSLVSKFPIPGSEGQPHLIGGMAIDITDRLRAEEALKEINRLKDQFMAMLAHELRNPLAPIRNAMAILKQPDVDPATSRQSLELANRQVDHMARLLDDLLDVSRFSRGRIELQSETIDVCEAARQAVAAIRPEMSRRRVDLTTSLPDSPLYVMGDAVRLDQVLTNLLTNACKYTDAGGRVTVEVGREGPTIVLRVRDTGIGISAEMLPRIFDAFVQADRRVDRSQGGIGVGLTLVKKLVELHGGTITAHSGGLHQGSEFVVRLPELKNAGRGTALPASQPRAATPTPRRILVVDDNQDAATSLGMLLRLQGHDVRTVFDGASALAAAEEFGPDAVFLDIGMPGMDGLEVAKRLRQRPAHRDTVLIALSGWGQESDQRSSQEAGFDEHLVKPADVAALERALGGSKGHSG